MNSSSGTKSNNRSVRFVSRILIIISILCIIHVGLLSLTTFGIAKSYNTLQSLKQDQTNLIQETNKSKTQTCKSNACYKASNFILSNLNQTVNICDDFYQFTCGNWISKTENDEKDHFTHAFENLLTDISDILTEPINLKHESQLVRNFKLYYQSCLNQTDVEFNSDAQFLELMSYEVGEWPLVPYLKKNINSNYQAKFLENSVSLLGIEEFLFKLINLGMPLMFRFESNDFNHTKILMHLIIPSDFCKIQNFLPNNTKSRKEFTKMVRNMRNYMLESVNNDLEFNSSVYNVSFDEQIDEMLNLANQMFFVSADSKYSCYNTHSRQERQQQRKTTHLFTIDQLNEQINSAANNSFDFITFVNFFNKKSAKHSLNNKSQVTITALTLNYLKDLLNGLNKLSNDNKTKFRRSFINLIYFNSILSIIKPLELFSTPHIHLKFPIRYYHNFFEYSKNINQQITPIDNFKSIYRINQEKNCAYSVIDMFSVADSFEQAELQRLFLKKKFNPKIKDRTQEILLNIKKVSIDLINKQAWIDNENKKSIMERLDSIEFKMAYSDTLFDDANITNIKSDDYDLTRHYIKNIFIIKKKYFEKEFQLLEIQQLKRIRSKKYIFDIFLANLIYLKEYNTLIMPAGVLLQPIFSIDNPIYLNYATIGVYIAHEIWHMIDDELIKSDKSRIGYEKHLYCLRDNYANYVKDNFDFEIEGFNSIAEQIADNFGVIVALRAYLNILEGNNNINNNSYAINQLLPGLSFDQKQAFFIRYAISYCRSSNTIKKDIKQFEKLHVIHQFRAFQVTLIPEFHSAFKCTSSSTRLTPYKIFDVY